MSSNWLLLMAIAALAHAGWNFFLKQSENKKVFLWSLRFWALIIFLTIGAVLRTGTDADVSWLPWGAGSAAFHSLYSLLLIKAYERSELAFVYPIARGTAPLITIMVGWTLLGERVNPFVACGALLVVTGIVVLYAIPQPSRANPLAAVVGSPWPLLVGVCVAGYSVFDKLAVANVPPIALNVMQNIGQVIVLGAIALRSEGIGTIRRLWGKHWPKMALSGLLVGLAYVLVLVVMTSVPVSRVAPVRESSILCGAILGYVFLKERLGRRGIIGAVLIFLGVITAAS